MNGAIEGTRTPTPLRVHGPEPCASANSATMASGLQLRGDHKIAVSGRPTFLFYRREAMCQTSLCKRTRDAVFPSCTLLMNALRRPEPLLQLRAHRNFRVQHLRHRTPLLRRLRI